MRRPLQAVWTDELLRTQWLGYLDADPAASIYHHPDLASSPTPGDPAEVLTGWRQAEDLAWLRNHWLAIVRARRIAQLALPGGRRVLGLHGLQLLGDRPLGRHEYSAALGFVRAANQLLKSGRFDCVLVESVQQHSPLWQVLQQQRHHSGSTALFYPAQPHWWIRLPEEGAAYWRQFSGKSRYNLRRAAARLPHQMTCYRRESDVERFLVRAQDVSARSWQGSRLGARVRQCREQAEFLRVLARLGALRCYTLDQHNQPLAFVVGWQWKDRFVYEECGHAREHAPRSPGTVLLYRIVEDLLAHDTPQWLDFGFGDSEQKRLFANEQTASARVVLYARRLRPTLARWFCQMQRTCSSPLRTALDRVQLHRMLRRRHRLRPAR